MALTRPESWATVTIRVSAHARERLLGWAKVEERSVVDIVDALIAAEERWAAWNDPAHAYEPDEWDLASLADDPEAARAQLLTDVIIPRVSPSPST